MLLGCSNCSTLGHTPKVSVKHSTLPSTHPEPPRKQKKVVQVVVMLLVASNRVGGVLRKARAPLCQHGLLPGEASSASSAASRAPCILLQSVAAESAVRAAEPAELALHALC